MSRDAADPRPDFDNVNVTDGSFVTHSRHHESSGERYVPHIAPDHGRQPRRPNRPLKVVYNRDRANLYRPADDPWLQFERDADAGDTVEHPRFSKQREISRLLAKTARAEAPKLSWRRSDDAIAEVIEREVLPRARWVAASLPKDTLARVLEEFVRVLRDEIALHKANSRVTKT